MSLIEEALRKQREESEKPGNISVTPPPIPPSASEETPQEPSPPDEPAHRSWVLLAGIAGGGVLAILFIAWLLIYGLGLWRDKPNATIAKTTILTNAPPSSTLIQQVNRSNDMAQVPAPPASPATTPAPPLLAPPPAQAALPPTTQTAKLQPSAPEAQGVPPPTTPLAEKAVPLPKSPPPAAPAKLELPVVWPKLTVSGVIGSSKSGRSAVILNGQMLSPGDTIEGVSIESIDKQKVKLKFSGEIKLLAVGASTE